MFRTVFRDAQNLSLRILWNLSRMQLSNSKGVKLLRSPTLFYNHFRLVVFMFFMLYCVFFRAGNSLIRSFAHRLFSHRSFAHLLISLKSNERMWANRSVRSWVTMSDLLRSLMINERMSDSLKTFWLNKSKILFFSMLYIRKKNDRLAHSLFFGEQY